MPARAATFNVADYGAVGDDSTDNTTAFTACLNAVVAAGGGRMYLPAGSAPRREADDGTARTLMRCRWVVMAD